MSGNGATTMSAKVASIPVRTHSPLRLDGTGVIDEDVESRLAAEDDVLRRPDVGKRAEVGDGGAITGQPRRSDRRARA